MTDIKKTDSKNDHEGFGVYGAGTYNEYTFLEAPKTDQITRGFGGELGVFYQDQFKKNSPWGFSLSAGLGLAHLTDKVTSAQPSEHSGYVPPEESTDGECHDFGHTGQCDEAANTDDDPETEVNNNSTNGSYKDVNDMSHYYLSLKALANVGVMNRSVIFHLGPEVRFYNFFDGGDLLGISLPDASLSVQGADGSLDLVKEIRFAAGGHGAVEVRPARAIGLFAGASVLAGTAEAFGSIVQSSNLEDGATVSNPGGTTRYPSDIWQWDATVGVKIYTDNINLKSVGEFFKKTQNIQIGAKKQTTPKEEASSGAAAKSTPTETDPSSQDLQGDKKLQHLLTGEAEKRGITLGILLENCHFAKGYPFYSTEEKAVIAAYTDGTPPKRVALQDDKIIELVVQAISQGCVDCDKEETPVRIAPKPATPTEDDSSINLETIKSGDKIPDPDGSGKTYVVEKKSTSAADIYYYVTETGEAKVIRTDYKEE